MSGLFLVLGYLKEKDIVVVAFPLRWGTPSPHTRWGCSLVWGGGHVKQGENMSAQENRTNAASRANDLITQVRGAKGVSASARQEIAELAQQASEVGVSSNFVAPVVEALKQTNKAVCAAVLGIERTTTAFGKSATMTNLGHMLYQIHAKENPFSFTKRETKRKLSAEDKAWLRANCGNDWYGDNGVTDPVRKAASIAALDASKAGAPAPEPMAEASNDTIDISALTPAQMQELLSSLVNNV